MSNEAVIRIYLVMYGITINRCKIISVMFHPFFREKLVIRAVDFLKMLSHPTSLVPACQLFMRHKQDAYPTSDVLILVILNH